MENKGSPEDRGKGKEPPNHVVSLELMPTALWNLTLGCLLSSGESLLSPWWSGAWGHNPDGEIPQDSSLLSTRICTQPTSPWQGTWQHNANLHLAPKTLTNSSSSSISPLPISLWSVLVLPNSYTDSIFSSNWRYILLDIQLYILEALLENLFLH